LKRLVNPAATIAANANREPLPKGLPWPGDIDTSRSAWMGLDS
jgi:hypothetical protein